MVAELRTADALIWYDDAGSGVPVVFAHPASGSHASWREQCDAFLKEGYRCITYDLRGWGQSRSLEAEADPGCMSDDLLALIDHLQLEQFVLIAAAYGGFGGLDFGMRFPQRLRAFVLSGSQGGVADPGYVAIRERVVPPEIRALPIHLRELGPSYRVRDPQGMSRWLEIAEQAEHHPARRQRMALDIRLEDLDTLRVPTLLVAGGADLLAPPALMRRIADHIGGCEFVTLCEAGHCLHWEQPYEWNTVVLEWLGRTLQAPGVGTASSG